MQQHREQVRFVKLTDDATRERLLSAAGPIFAELGFQAASIRQICARAEVNVAAVNYHFGDKLGLYKAVLRASVRASLTPVDPRLTAAGLPPAMRIQRFIYDMLGVLLNPGRPAWSIRLIMQEMALPSPALDDLIEQIIRPRHEVLSAAVGELLGRAPRARLTQLCVHSIVGQVRHYFTASHVLSRIWPEFTFTPKELDEVTEHITAFSLAAIHALAERPATLKKTAARRKRA